MSQEQSQTELLKRIVQYLKSLKDSNLDPESLEVAAETIQIAVGLSDQDIPKSGPSLLEIFRAGLDHLSSSPEGKTSSDENDDSKKKEAAEAAEEDPAGFQSFLGLLEKRGFFQGAPEGSPERAERMEKARSTFQQRRQQDTAADDKPHAAPSERERQEAAEFKSQGNAHISAGRNQEAVHAYTQAIQLDPTVPVYFCNRAAALLKLQRYQEALEDCEKTLQLDPVYVKAFWRKGKALEGLGKTQEAIAALEAGMQHADPPTKAELERELEQLLKRAEDDSPPGGAGMPDLSSLAGMFGGAGGAGGAGGGFDFGALMNNPMVQQILQNPELMQQAMGMFGGGGGGGGGSGGSADGGGGGGGFDLGALLNNPAIAQMMSQFANPQQQQQQQNDDDDGHNQS